MPTPKVPYFSTATRRTFQPAFTEDSVVLADVMDSKDLARYLSQLGEEGRRTGMKAIRRGISANLH